MGNKTAINPGMYPMQNYNYIYQMGNLREDICAGPMCNQMYGAQFQYCTPPVNFGGNGGNEEVPQQAPQASNGCGPLITAGVVGGATYWAGTRLNIIKPVDENGKFTEEFLSHASGQYAAVYNAESLKNFYGGIAGKDVITAENYGKMMTDLEKLGHETNPAQIEKLLKENPLLKSVLEKNGVVDANGVFKPGKSVQDVRNVFADIKCNGNRILPKHNYLNQSQMVNRFKGLEEAWSKCTTKEAQIKFLRENADILGFKSREIEVLHYAPESLTITNPGRITERIRNCGEYWTKTMEETKAGMQGLSGAWKGEKWYSWGNKFEHSGKGVAESLGNGLKSLRKSKVKWVALAATLGTWLFCKLSK